MEMLKQATGTDMVHVPFAGAAPATTALLGGQVQAMFNNMLSAVPHLREGRLRALAVSGLSRSPVLPDVPAVAETIPGFDATTWYGALAPAGTPAPVVERLRAVLAGAVRGSAVKEQLLAQGVEAAPSTPAEFTRFIEAELRKWRDAARAAGVRVD
jgi:tripartite-type tricarboxylate transporter receptor subunit TctC